ncbi:MAG: chitobiase/beta-hexosaminidase C-terminal domain-containing protein, partial [Nitrospirota bacterium]
PAEDNHAAFSPDGSKIAFSSYRDGNYEIYVMDADGTGQTNLTNNPGIDVWPAWSPDGTKIAFASFRDGNQEIYVMNADGTGQNRLTYNPAQDVRADWGPSASLPVDTTPPVTSLSSNPSSPDGTNGWFITTPSITLTRDEPGTTYYSWVSATGPWTTYSTPFNAPEGQNTLYYYSVDTAGNAETVKGQLFKVDTIAPTTSALPAGGTYASAQNVTLTCNDGGGSGCDKIYYTTDGLTPTTSSPVYSSPINITTTTTLKFFAKDLAGNIESVKTEIYTLPVGDTTPPVTSLSNNPASPDGTNGWFINTPSITLSINNEPGTTYYRWHFQSSWTTYTGSFNAPQGNNTLYYYSVDLAGNPELVKSAAFKVDTQAPTAPSNVIAMPMSSSQINLSWNASTDATSGVGGYKIYNAGTGAELVTTTSTSYSFGGLPASTTYSYYVKAYDAAGNISGQSNTVSATTFAAPVSTPPGSDVSVDLGNDIQITFSEINNSGTTTVTVSETAPAPAPPGFSFLGYFYHITTTASYIPPITVTIPYDESLVVGAEANLRLFHWENNQWRDVTVSVDTVNNTITGQVNSLSPFGIGYPVPLGPPIGPSTGANTYMIAFLGGLLAISAGVFFIKRHRRLQIGSF